MKIQALAVGLLSLLSTASFADPLQAKKMEALESALVQGIFRESYGDIVKYCNWAWKVRIDAGSGFYCFGERNGWQSVLPARELEKSGFVILGSDTRSWGDGLLVYARDNSLPIESMDQIERSSARATKGEIYDALHAALAKIKRESDQRAIEALQRKMSDALPKQ